MASEMRKWIAKKLFELALRLDFETTETNARLLVYLIADIASEIKKQTNKPKKRGRPLGSKNKPKVQS